MRLKCPVCGLDIRGGEGSVIRDAPESGPVYWCKLCRLDLIWDGHKKKLISAPLRARMTVGVKMR